MPQLTQAQQSSVTTITERLPAHQAAFLIQRLTKPKYLDTLKAALEAEKENKKRPFIIQSLTQSINLLSPSN